MDEKEKPITDKENFPPSEDAPKIARYVVGVEQLAYSDGVMNGYRKAMIDIMCWSLVFVLAIIVAREISVTN